MAHKRSYAAYAREDVDDAKRGEPTVSLAPWAEQRGVTYLGGKLVGQFSSVLPRWENYVFNACKGPVAPGRFGYLAHELEEIPSDEKGSPDRGGSFYSVRGYAKSRGILNLVGIEKARPNEPFAALAFWVPTTKVAIRMPEAALLPAITIRSSERLPYDTPKLDDAGLPGFRMASNQWVDDDLRLAVGGAVAPIAGLGAPFVGVRIDRGVVAIHRNGFVAGDAALDQMAGVAARVADGLIDVAGPLVHPQPFATELPPPDPAHWPPGCVTPQDHEADVFRRAAEEFGMVQEDPMAFHAMQPHCPVPGRALGLVRGRLPGTTTDGRIGFFEQGRNTSGTYRSAVIVPARGDASTPLGGALDTTSDLYVEVADGVVYAWPRVRTVGGLEAAKTAAAAVDTFRRLGLADV